ncbi:uncharacterized protein LOC130665766 [Microplitis mediator]|uniref:uncharacterized protein LOC130665766 n=1 Tax=Microplitis mediator TaxID=375433 RepID=UPI00255395DE|nr:uncharacterized protein LOC130665766 [Microplitis mediator]
MADQQNITMNQDLMALKNVWEIDDVIGFKSWINSESLYSGGFVFDLALRRVEGQKFLHLRVRKNDLRSVNATVQIKQIQSTDLNLQKSRFITDYNEVPSYMNSPTSTVIGESETNDWKQCFILKIENYKNESSTVLTKNKSFIHMKMTLECQITSLSCIDDKFEKIIPTNFMPYLEANLFNDIVLVVDNVELPAHKVILSAHSPHFHKMLTTEMKEVKENRITIEKFPLDVITEMLDFFYTGKTKASSDVDVALKMIEVAQMYEIGSMIKICENTITKNININNIVSIIKLVDDLNIIQLRNNAIKFMSNNISDLGNLSELKNLCKSKPMLMYELIRVMGKKKSPTFSC